MKCKVCDGKGYLNEQEYIQNCTMEQLVEWLQEHMDCASCGCKTLCHQGHNCKLALMEWLKQPHTSQTPQKQDDYPCNVKCCSLETRQSCCGCPDYFKWKKNQESR